MSIEEMSLKYLVVEQNKTAANVTLVVASLLNVLNSTWDMTHFMLQFAMQ